MKNESTNYSQEYSGRYGTFLVRDTRIGAECVTQPHGFGNGAGEMISRVQLGVEETWNFYSRVLLSAL